MTDQYSVKLTMGLLVDITSTYPDTTVQNVLREYNAETTLIGSYISTVISNSIIIRIS